jgi:hypothetical protein
MPPLLYTVHAFAITSFLDGRDLARIEHSGAGTNTVGAFFSATDLICIQCPEQSSPISITSMNTLSDTIKADRSEQMFPQNLQAISSLRFYVSLISAFDLEHAATFPTALEYSGNNSHIDMHKNMDLDWALELRHLSVSAS